MAIVVEREPTASGSIPPTRVAALGALGWFAVDRRGLPGGRRDPRGRHRRARRAPPGRGRVHDRRGHPARLGRRRPRPARPHRPHARRDRQRRASSAAGSSPRRTGICVHRRARRCRSRRRWPTPWPPGSRCSRSLRRRRAAPLARRSGRCERSPLLTGVTAIARRRRSPCPGMLAAGHAHTTPTARRAPHGASDDGRRRAHGRRRPAEDLRPHAAHRPQRGRRASRCSSRRRRRTCSPSRSPGSRSSPTPPSPSRMGFVSIGDGFLGYEHYLNAANMNDDKILDPDYPESLVFDTSVHAEAARGGHVHDEPRRHARRRARAGRQAHPVARPRQPLLRRCRAWPGSPTATATAPAA